MTRIAGFDGLTILGTGIALPPRCVDNAELLGLLDLAGGPPVRMTPKGLGKLSGVETRYWTHEIGRPTDHLELTSLDLAIAASQRALDDAGVDSADVDGLLVVTTTAPRPSVNTGNHVAKALGLKGFALELKAGCAGALFGLVLSAAMMGLGASRILLVATEAWTKLIPATLPGPLAVAGDGAAALFLGRGKGALLGGALHTAPEHAGAMMPPGLFPPTPEAIEGGDYLIRLTEDIAETVRDFYPWIYDESLAAAHLGRADVDLLIPHQASLPILRRAMRDCGSPASRSFHTLAQYGNVSSASVLLSLHDARQSGMVGSGSRVALVAVGGGITAAAVILRI